MGRHWNKGHSRLARLVRALAWLAIAVAAIMWLIDRSLPTFVHRRIENALSAGPVAVSFEGVSFNVFRGLTMRGVRVFRKKVLGGPLVAADELRVGFNPDFSRPALTWVSEIASRGLHVAPYPVWEAFVDETGDGAGDDPALERLLAAFTSCDEPPPPIRFSADDADVMCVRCRYLEFDISLPADALRLDRISIIPATLGFREHLDGFLLYDYASDRFDVALTGSLTPPSIRDLTLSLDGDVPVEYYDVITQLQAPLQVAGGVTLDYGGDYDLSDVRLTVSGGDFLYRGHPVRNVKMGLQWLSDSRNAGDSGRRLVISPLDATFRDGKFSGRLAWYPRTHATDLSAKSALPLRQLFDVIDMPLPDCATNAVFATPPRAEASGRVYAAGAGLDHFTGKFAAPVGTIHRVPTDNLSFDWEYSEERGTATVTNLVADCCGGRVGGSLEVVTAREGDFRLGISVDGAHTDPLRRALGLEAPNSGGHLSFSAEIGGQLSSNVLSTLSGSVSASARHAAITRIPLFAGLTDFMARNVAGIDLLVMQSDADLAATIDDGLVTVGRMTVDGNMLSIVGKGKCRIDAPGMPAEGVAQVRFFHTRSVMGYLARIITLPVSKLMEFRVHGPIEKPSWDYIGLIDRIAEATFWPRKDATAQEE